MKYNPYIVWTGIILYFVIFETIGIIHEYKFHTDTWTFTHYLARIPMSIKVALIAWIAYHFLWEHPLG